MSAEYDAMAEALDRLVYGRIGNYVLVRVIGRATHYTLYQAADTCASRMVLIKTLHVADTYVEGGDEPEAGDRRSVAREGTPRETSPILQVRLQREADALGRLSHPNVVAMYETGEQDGYPFLVMEYLYGHPLRQHLDQRPLPMAEAVGILEQIADGLDAVHAQGILHRDIRPSNVMIMRDGRVKLVDFGLARQPGDTTVTLMGQLVGEPAYMSPEQLRNKPASPETDIWAMGVLLYEMLAGEPPFQGTSFPLVAHQVLMGEPTPIPGVSKAVQAVVSRALEKDPEKRYAHAREMVADLRKALGRSHEPALRMDEPRRQFFSSQPPVVKTAAMIGAGVLALVVSALMGMYLSHAALVMPLPEPTVSAATLPRYAAPAPTPAPPPASQITRFGAPPLSFGAANPAPGASAKP